MSDQDSARHLSVDAAREFLARHRFGRMAIVLADEPHIFPVNFVLDAERDDHTVLYIRSAPGDKLFAAAANKRVAFEVDEVRDAGATSVIAYGSARVATTEEELERVAALGLTPWIATYKPEVIAVDVIDLSGREFIFGPEPDEGLMEPTA